jgi:Rha family phage regulatory protein
MSNLVFIENGQVLTDSLKLAEKFGKEHKNVKRDINLTMESIESLKGSVEAEELGIDFDTLKFEPIEYRDTRNRVQEKYHLSYDAFMLVTMSYTTQKAMLVKIDYINKFNEMKTQLKEIDTMMNDKGELTEEKYAEVKFSTVYRVKKTFLDSQDIFKDYERFVAYSRKTMDTKLRVRRLNQIIETLKIREDELYRTKRKGYRAERENIIELTEVVLKDINVLNNRSYGQKLGHVKKKIG